MIGVNANNNKKKKPTTTIKGTTSTGTKAKTVNNKSLLLSKNKQKKG